MFIDEGWMDSGVDLVRILVERGLNVPFWLSLFLSEADHLEPHSSRDTEQL